MAKGQLLHRVLTVASLFFSVSAQYEFDVDPYLQYRPAFARSLPVQILLTGIVLTLVAVLFIHLIFTAQYHWPLAPVNYVLQISGVTTLLISLIATLHVVLSATLDESRKWPYMLSYVAVGVPPLDMSNSDDDGNWSVAEKATWLVMSASTSGLVQITHIQFLTLLYPSRLEGRLIFLLLGPLAIVSAIMQLVPIHGSDTVIDIASAVRNVCNATLSLLFTASLFIWGLLVNRKQAWRTDGGTAAFGAAALVLAVASTALNFLYVPREEEYVWLPGLMWAIILWQSFLGWWWWVGAGSGGTTNGWDDKDSMEEEMNKREKREKRRKAKMEKRRETRERAKLVLRGVAGAFGKKEHSGDEGRSDRRRHRQQGPDDRPRSRSESHSRSPLRSPTSPTTSPRSSVSTSSLSTVPTYATLPRILPLAIHRWYASLRRAHVAAARKQAVERAERIRELERNGSGRRSVNRQRDPGWGLGSFGWRIGHERHHHHHRHREEEIELEDERGRGRPPRAYVSSAKDEVESEGEGEGEGEVEGEGGVASVAHDREETSAEAVPKRRRTSRDADADADAEESPQNPSSTTTTADPATDTNTTSQQQQRSSSEDRHRSVWWWGPLGRWRLQDSTVY